LHLDVSIERLGLVLEPDGSPLEAGGVLNPACARTPEGELLLYPRDVERGNISRIGRVRVTIEDGRFAVEREGFALEPREAYELRPSPGYGCEDPRVTFVPRLQSYVMAYTAFGPAGPRIAIALSKDARTWERLGLVNMGEVGITGDDKDAAFFPEPVLSPAGVLSYAYYHRPMLHLSAIDGRAAIPLIERMAFSDRESIRIAYVPVAEVDADVKNLLNVRESVVVLSPDAAWGSIKVGSGTPPVRIAEGWMSIFHGVDLLEIDDARPKFRYVAGLVIHDAERPDRVLYRSPHPIFVPTSDRECDGVVNNVVFPTGIDPRPDLGARTFDVYYGMADYSIGAFRISL
jgi:predicted GH43/DUF377 family glycosyl hydrolase